MKSFPKKNFPVANIRRFLEPGPIVLISSAHKNERNIMTLGWHLMMGFEPALVGCFIWDQNHSFSLIRRSRECVINVPTLDMIDAVIGIGNCHGSDLKRGRERRGANHPATDLPADKFEAFGLTAAPATKVSAPLIAECYANFECKLIDTSLINKYSLFIFEAVKAHVAKSPPAPRYPKTVHYRGEGIFMIAGPSKSYRRKFKRGNL